MSFAALVTDMTAVILSEDGVAEPAVLVIASGDEPVPTTALIDEPSETAHRGIPQPVLRERKTTLTLPWPAATGIRKGSTVAVDEGGTGLRIRNFVVDSVSSREPDQVIVNVREVTA